MSALDIVKAHYAAGAAGDPAGMAKDFADDIVWIEAEGGPFPGRFVGMPAIGEGVFGPLNEAFDNFRVLTDEFYADGKVVIMIGRYAATARATGKPVETRVVHKWTVRDDKIVEMEQIVDSHLMWLAQQP